MNVPYKLKLFCMKILWQKRGGERYFWTALKIAKNSEKTSSQTNSNNTQLLSFYQNPNLNFNSNSHQNK